MIIEESWILFFTFAAWFERLTSDFNMIFSFTWHVIYPQWCFQSDSSSVEIGSLDSTSVRSLERHFVLRLTSGQLPSNAFHTLMEFILHVSQPKYGVLELSIKIYMYIALPQTWYASPIMIL